MYFEIDGRIKQFNGYEMQSKTKIEMRDEFVTFCFNQHSQ